MIYPAALIVFYLLEISDSSYSFTNFFMITSPDATHLT